eukprot:scaffold120755_cov40-Prasinocladus_malaysianus.AAC.1
MKTPVGVEHGLLYANNHLSVGFVGSDEDVVPGGDALKRDIGVGSTTANEYLVEGIAGRRGHLQLVVNVDVNPDAVGHHLKHVPPGGAGGEGRPPGVEHGVAVFLCGRKHAEAVPLKVQHLLGVVDGCAVVVVGTNPVARSRGVAVVEGGLKYELLLVGDWGHQGTAKSVDGVNLEGVAPSPR